MVFFVLTKLAPSAKRLDFCLFTAPLLTLQICNAIIPVLMSIGVECAVDEEDPESIHAKISTTVSAISAALIGIQLKLKLAEIGEKYN